MGEVLGDLGNFHIWKTLILGPLSIILIVLVAVFLWNHQKGWAAAKGTVLNDPSCSPCSGSTCQQGQVQCSDTEVRVLVGDTDQTWTMSSVAPHDLSKGSFISVCYDPEAPKKNHASGTQCMSPTVRDIAVGVCVLGALVTAGWWVVNLTLRKNKNFQQASGVLESADLASDVLGGGGGNN